MVGGPASALVDGAAPGALVGVVPEGRVAPPPPQAAVSEATPVTIRDPSRSRTMRRLPGGGLSIWGTLRAFWVSVHHPGGVTVRLCSGRLGEVRETWATTSPSTLAERTGG